jgi:ribosomal protein S14
MARPIDADPNEDFWCGYCGKDVNEGRDPGGYYLYCSEECSEAFDNKACQSCGTHDGWWDIDAMLCHSCFRHAYKKMGGKDEQGP